MSPRVSAAAAMMIVTTMATSAFSAEGGVGFYLLGSRGAGAALVPPSGVYLQHDSYFYSGKASTSIPKAGNINLNLDANAALGLATALWVPDGIDWGGVRPYFSATIVTGYADVAASAELDLPGGNTLRRGVGEDSFTIGDPGLGAGVGGGSGPFFWSANVLVNLPIGDYKTDRLSNIAFNHWGVDTTLAMTWMDRTTGWEVSGALGMTMNGTNKATNYRTGNEAHFEGSVSRNLPSGWSLGLNGYHYQQISGDSGSGAKLGAYKGRVTGIGPAVSYAAKWGETPITLKARWFHEFNVKNRVKGNAVFLTASMPL